MRVNGKVNFVRADTPKDPQAVLCTQEMLRFSRHANIVRNPMNFGRSHAETPTDTRQ